jgi:maltose O-acetyltransferase
VAQLTDLKHAPAAIVTSCGHPDTSRNLSLQAHRYHAAMRKWTTVATQRSAACWSRARSAIERLPTRLRRKSRKVAAEVAMSPIIRVPTRRALLRYAGIRVGRQVDVRDRVRFAVRRTTLQDHCFVSTGCYFEDHAEVTVGPHVWIGAYCKIQTATHEIGPPDCRAGKFDVRPVSIGAGSWLGAGVTVLPGVTIGQGCVIAAGAVVTSDCQSNGLYAGVPASLRRLLAADRSGRGGVGEPVQADHQAAQESYRS